MDIDQLINSDTITEPSGDKHEQSINLQQGFILRIERLGYKRHN